MPVEAPSGTLSADKFRGDIPEARSKDPARVGTLDVSRQGAGQNSPALDSPAPRLTHPAIDAPRPPSSALLACGVVGATLLDLLARAQNGRRIAQLAVRAAPPVLWLLWPLHSARLRRWRTALVWLWVMGFGLDAVVRAYLLGTYQAPPDSAMGLGAGGNTNARVTMTAEKAPDPIQQAAPTPREAVHVSPAAVAA